LEDDTKILREKVAILELEKSVREKRAELADLRLEKKGLEDKLTGPWQTSVKQPGHIRKKLL